MTYLKTSRLNFLAECHLLALDLIQIQGCEGTMDLSDNIVPRIPIKAEHDKVQRHGLQIVQGEAVESKVFVVGGVPGVPHDSVEYIWNPISQARRWVGNQSINHVYPPT